MFKKPWYRIALNVSLRELGISTTRLNPGFREEVVELVMDNGLSPQEGALLVYSRVSASMNSMDRIGALSIVRHWRLSPNVRKEIYQRIFHTGHQARSQGLEPFSTTQTPLRG